MNSTKLLLILLGIVLVVGIGAGVLYVKSRQTPTNYTESTTTQPVTQKSTAPSTSTSKTSDWTEQGAAIAGNYADSDIVLLDDGTYRMYYAIEPEVANGNLDIFSSTSKDGITWTKEDGTRQKMATFPDVFKTSDGQWRMNYQSAGTLKSSISKDGLTFTAESGTRIDTTNDAGLTFDNVAAPTTLKLADGTYLMVYRGSINEPYTKEMVPNKTQAVLMYATSTDGKAWVKKGLAIDTRSDTNLKGWADGPELVAYDTSETRLYFSTYTGVYYSTFSGGKFSTPKFTFILPNPTNANDPFGGMPPDDPTLAKINGTWMMYYGVHTKGIYRASLK